MKNFFTYIIGDAAKFSLQQRLANAVLLLSVLFGIQATIGNIVLKLPPLTIYASAFMGIVLYYLYYIARFRKKTNIAVVIGLLIAIFFYIPVMWIGNAGYEGGMVYYLFLYGAFATSLLEGKKIFLFISIFIVEAFILYFLQYHQQIPIYNYNTPFDKLLDLLVSFLFVMIGITVTIYIYRTQYQKSQKLLEQKNIKLNQLVEEVSSQRDEIMAQRDRMESQYKIIEQQQEDISGSIQYAKKIQDAVLPQSELMSSVLGDYGLFYKPKDIVGGDFYWLARKDNYYVVAVADCTGHGVPGGFMSMLGVSFLNEIINNESTLQASAILNHLRKSMIMALRQTGSIGEQADGMDMSLCVLNTETRELNYAGANNPVYIVSKREIDMSDKTKMAKLLDEEYKLYRLLPDKMPISHYRKMDSFSDCRVALNGGDFIYLFSDGYADQFGGDKGKKMGYRRFREMILQNATYPIDKQQQQWETILLQWQKDYEQVDDITILGIQV